MQEDKQTRKDSVAATKEPEVHGFALSDEQNTRMSDKDDFDGDTTYTSKTGRDFQIPVGLPYRVQYSIDQVITQADFSFLNTSYQ